MGNTMNSDEPRPKLIVFDLDYTLWPFYVDTHYSPPFHKDSKGNVLDRRNEKISLYTDTKDILSKLQSNNYTIAVASRTSATVDAEDLLDKFNLNKYITYKEIYPGCKKAHFSKFHKASEIPYEDMIFFDDEVRNIRDLSAIGVTCILVEDGINWKVLNDGLKQFRSKFK